MASWRELLRRPEDLSIEGWLTALGTRLLAATRLVVAGQPHRLVEVEAYYHSADHPDPFAHCDPIQLESGRWYFHKSHGIYRSGSFKGLDVTFGDGRAHGGVLFRGLEAPDGTLIDGPSLLVDHLLALTEKLDVRTLDLIIGKRAAWEDDNLLRLEDVDEESRLVIRTSRVGLSLKRQKPTPLNIDYLGRPYRFLTEPRRTAKGKVHVVLALHREGRSPEEIKKLSGCPTGTVQRYIADYEEGKKETDPSVYGGIDLGPRELCRLLGFAQRSG